MSHRPNVPVTTCAAALALLLGVAPAHAALFEVGGNAGCTHASLQAALNAAAATPEVDVIVVTRSVAYTSQALSISNHSVYLRGGYAGCGAARDGIRTLLTGNNVDPVMRITGAGEVDIDGLELTNGNTSAGGNGGGLRIEQTAAGRVYLQNVRIHNNNAGRGGAISVSGSGTDPATGPLLTLRRDVTLLSNHARFDGGALYCRGARLAAVGDAIAFVANLADRHGGGLMAEFCGLELASGGGIFAAMFSGNGAGALGGAIAMFNSTAQAYTFRSDAPVRFSNNSADLGGAIAVVDASRFTGYETRFDQNRAYVKGGAIHQFNGVVSATNRVLLRRRRGAGPGVDCDVAGCGTLSGNEARDETGTLQRGAVLQGASTASLGHVETVLAGQQVFDNAGIGLLHTYDPGYAPQSTRVVLENTLVHHNEIGYAMIDAGGATAIDVTGVTIADNGLGGRIVTFGSEAGALPNRLRFRNSLVAEGPDVLLLSHFPQAAPTLDLAYIRSEGDLDPRDVYGASEGPPGFVDATQRDYRLRATSAAVDVAPPELGSESEGRDLAGAPRSVDLPGYANGSGTQDLGALESTTILFPDLLVDGFESEG